MTNEGQRARQERRKDTEVLISDLHKQMMNKYRTLSTGISQKHSLAAAAATVASSLSGSYGRILNPI